MVVHIALKTAQALARHSTDPLASARAAAIAQHWLSLIRSGAEAAEPGVEEVLESITG